MKRITFLAVLIVALFSFGAAKAQVGIHVGVNIGRPLYYAPAPRVVVAPRPVVVYRQPVRRPVYYGRPVVVRRVYHSPRPVVVHHNRHAYVSHRKW